MGNATCYAERAPSTHPPLFQHGDVVFQPHHVGWIVTGFFASIACGVSFWLIGKHLMWYTNKRQQRQIVRLLLMIPIYSIVSFLSYIFWNHAGPMILVRDAYEAFILAAFFYLLLEYTGSSQAEQKEVFRAVELKKWMWPLGWVKYRPRDGLYFLQLMKWGVLQYCVLRPLTTLIAVILDFLGLYCEASWSPGWGHLYVVTIVSISVTVAMYCLIQLYMPIRKQLAPHKPVLKLFAVKALIFLIFWQYVLFGALNSFGVVKDTEFMTAEEINTGFMAIVVTFEMVLLAFLHVKCYTYRPYRLAPGQETPRWRSLMHALDFRDLWRETSDGTVYMWRTVRGQEPEIEIRRQIHLERAMGRGRASKIAAKPVLNEERKWLDVESPGRSLRVDIDEELQRRGLTFPVPEDGLSAHEPSRRQRSWWRSVYDRLSQSAPGRNSEPEKFTVLPRHSRYPSESQRVPSLEDPPPRSALYGRRRLEISDELTPDHDLGRPRGPTSRADARLIEGVPSPQSRRGDEVGQDPGLGIARSDSVLGRVFRQVDSIEEQSATTHASPRSFRASPLSSSHGHWPSSGMLLPVTHLSNATMGKDSPRESNRGPPRPQVVQIPAPLSPARYSRIDPVIVPQFVSTSRGETVPTTDDGPLQPLLESQELTPSSSQSGRRDFIHLPRAEVQMSRPETTTRQSRRTQRIEGEESFLVHLNLRRHARDGDIDRNIMTATTSRP